MLATSAVPIWRWQNVSEADRIFCLKASVLLELEVTDCRLAAGDRLLSSQCFSGKLVFGRLVLLFYLCYLKLTDERANKLPKM